MIAPNETKLAAGKLLSIDNQIDTTTGTLKLRAIFDNKNNLLFPNQFVNARLLVKTLDNVTLIPSSAIQHNGQASFVFLIQNDVAHIRNIKPGVSEGQHDGSAGAQPGRCCGRQQLRKAAGRLQVTVTKQVLLPSNSESECPVSPSRPFILRPVATSLLMAAIMLVGIVAYTQLPVSALPEVDYPTIQVLTFYPGASPDVMATTVTAPLERQFGEMQGLSQMTSTSSGGTSVIVLQFNLSPEHRHGRGRGAVGDQRRAELPARGSAGAAHLQQDQSGRRAGADAGHHLEHDAALPGGGPGRHAPGAQDLAAERRGAGQHQRRTEAGGAHPGKPGAAALLRHRLGGPAHRAGRTPASTRPRETSTDRARIIRSTPTINWSPAPTTRMSSWPTATARRYC